MSVVSDGVVSVGRWEKLLEDTLRMPSVNGANTVRVQTSGECQMSDDVNAIPKSAGLLE